MEKGLLRISVAPLAAVLLFCLLYTQAAFCSEEQQTTSSNADRIFFATDRLRRGSGCSMNFGRQDTDKLTSLSYGATRADKGWFFPTSEDSSDKSDAIFEDKEFDGFTDLLRSSLKTNGQTRFIIFVHGCCTSFRQSLKLGSDLQKETGIPVVIYDWGSPTGSYAGSLLAWPRSQERFNHFVDKMTAAFPDSKVALVALSLGSELVDEYCAQSRSTSRMQCIILARADIDSLKFSSHYDHIKEHAGHIYVCAADNDYANIMSTLLRHIASPTAGGDRVGNIDSGIRSDPDLTVLDVSPLNEGHDLPCTVIGDLIKCEAQPVPSGDKYSYEQKADGTVLVSPR